MITIEEYIFNNKVWIPATRKSRVIKLLLMISGAVYLATTFIQILFDGFFSINFMSQVVFPFVVFGLGFFYSGKGGYITSDCRMAVGNDIIEILYPHINRNDRYKEHSEKITIRKSCIISIDYSSYLKSIRVISRPKVGIEYAGKIQEIDFTCTKEPCTTILYVNEGQDNQIINSIEQELQIKVNKY